MKDNNELNNSQVLGDKKKIEELERKLKECEMQLAHQRWIKTCQV